MFVSCVYVVFSCVCRGLCDGLITRPEESHRVSLYVWSQKPRKGPYVPAGNLKENEWMNARLRKRYETSVSTARHWLDAGILWREPRFKTLHACEELVSFSVSPSVCSINSSDVNHRACYMSRRHSPLLSSRCSTYLDVSHVSAQYAHAGWPTAMVSWNRPRPRPPEPDVAAKWRALFLRIREVPCWKSARRKAMMAEVFVVLLSPSRQKPKIS
jgi:hypothetical protein